MTAPAATLASPTRALVVLLRTRWRHLIACLRQRYICATYSGECEHCRGRKRRKG